VNKWLISALASSLVLAGCSSVPSGSIPVVEGGTPASRIQGATVTSNPQPSQAQSIPEDSGVVVMVPGGVSTTPIQSAPITSSIDTSGSGQAWTPSAATNYSAPAASGIPANGGGLALDEQLDGPVLALLTTAQQQQGSGDLNGASSSLERAQRIAPREPQVLYRLAEVSLAQGNAAQAEQFARRGLSYANGRPALQASLWELIAKTRESQGDAAGAAQARQQARVSS
jgi:hypothetical protein